MMLTLFFSQKLMIIDCGEWSLEDSADSAHLVASGQVLAEACLDSSVELNGVVPRLLRHETSLKPM